MMYGNAVGILRSIDHYRGGTLIEVNPSVFDNPNQTRGGFSSPAYSKTVYKKFQTSPFKWTLFDFESYYVRQMVGKFHEFSILPSTVILKD